MLKNIICRILPTATAIMLLSACGSEVSIPQDASPAEEEARIYPDYRDITIPPNIAPLNFRIDGGGEEFVARIGNEASEVITAASKDGIVKMDSTEWRNLLAENRGRDLSVSLYAKKDGQWLKYPDYKLSVAKEAIDPYLSYRLIEPGYELYRQVGLYQRNLSSFEQKPIYENNRSYDSINNHCVNCHNFQNYDTKRMIFHVRAKHGGTIIADNGKVKKVNMKCDSILSSTVYPTWHPTKPWIVFSSNQTGQAFHVVDKQKVEVMDYGSDLVFYDAEANTLTNILKTEADLETFPAFSPDGKKLYYCSAHVAQFEGKTTAQRMDMVINIDDSIRYNVMSMTFDPATRRFGQPVMEVDCAAMGKSASVPRVSPDGRYLLFTLGDYGQFHIWHKSADLYVKDLKTGEVRPLKEANSPDVDSYHAWSSNGRWIVFSSRRDDGDFTRLYVSYFSPDGRSHKAFIIPQESPQENIMLMKSYNVPEFTKSPVTVTPEDFRSAVYNDEAAEKVTYRK